jgi:hypothetical protein
MADVDAATKAAKEITKVIDRNLRVFIASSICRELLSNCYRHPFFVIEGIANTSNKKEAL